MLSMELQPDPHWEDLFLCQIRSKTRSHIKVPKLHPSLALGSIQRSGAEWREAIRRQRGRLGITTASVAAEGALG